MAFQPFKNIIVVGGSGTFGVPLVLALLSSNKFNVSVLKRTSSTATFPPGVNVKTVDDFTSHPAAVEALQDQDVLICTLTDSIASLQTHLIPAAIEAGVKRFIPSEFASSELKLPTKEFEDVTASRAAIIELLKQKVKETTAIGQEFHWTAVNNGLFFDWGLEAGFLDISLPPTKAATIWDSGSDRFSVTNVTTITSAVVAILSDRAAELESRDRFVHIASFPVSQKEIVVALETVTGEKWIVEKTTTEEQFAIAREEMEKGDVLSPYYRWIRGAVFSGQEACHYEGKLDNELLRLPRESLEGTVGKIIIGLHVF